MNATDIFDVEDDARKRYGGDYSIFKEADYKAQKFLVTSVDEKPLQYIMNCNTAKEMWDKQLSVYEQKSYSSVTLIQQKFYCYVINPDENMTSYNSKLENISRKLKQSDKLMMDL